MKPKRLSEVTENGWYVAFSLFDDADKKDIEKSLRYETNGHPELVLFDNGIFRGTSGHGITLEQPDYFGKNDLFIGPIDLTVKQDEDTDMTALRNEARFRYT